MPRGGYRKNAGGKSTWKCGKTTTIRVPVVLAEQLKEIARKLDNGESLVDDTGSKVVNFSGVSIAQVKGKSCVFLEDFLKVGYEIKPLKLAEKVMLEAFEPRKRLNT